MRPSELLLSLGFAAAVQATPRDLLQTPYRPRAVSVSASVSALPLRTIRHNACATVSSLSKAFAKTAPAGAYATVPAEIAYECIKSVPFDSKAALDLMDSIRPYLDWQTTLQYVKDPPVEYAKKVQPPYDFYAEFDRVYSKAQAGSYAGEYDFGFDLYLSMQRVHDGHFTYWPDSVTGVFSFGRSTPLVSVSLDGTSIPEVYAYADVLATIAHNASFTPSPLSMINGQDSTEWLLDFSKTSFSQDQDALWNSLFWINAQVSLGQYSGTNHGTFVGGGEGGWIYPGPNTRLSFANGTTITTQNYASVYANFGGIRNGADLRKRLTPGHRHEEPAISLAASSVAAASYSASHPASYSSSFPASSSSYPVSISSGPAAARTSMPAPGYPSPIVRAKDNQNSGYYLEGEGYDDVAVLSVPSFFDFDELEFQKVNTYFIDQAVKAGKTKLIIDVSANGGGIILQGYDLFKQLFPSILPDGYNRFRAHEASDLIGNEFSYYSGLVNRTLKANDTVLERISSTFNYRTDADIDYAPFPDWSVKYGPHAYGPSPDNYTSILRWNLSDPLTPYISDGIYISGYLKRSNITSQPFAAENIVIVYDGYCASTCAIFSELMTAQGGVKTIALGGRPNTAVMQAVGGVKGVNDYPYEYILINVEQAFKLHHYHSEDYYANNTVLGKYNDLAYLRSTNAVVNARDGIRKGDESQTPLQFLYQPANCRIFYTPEMVVDETAIWKTVADTAFNGISHCVAGSYPGAGTQQSTDSRVKHGIRQDLDLTAHYAALADKWTGRRGRHTRRAGSGVP